MAQQAHQPAQPPLPLSSSFPAAPSNSVECHRASRARRRPSRRHLPSPVLLHSPGDVHELHDPIPPLCTRSRSPSRPARRRTERRRRHGLRNSRPTSSSCCTELSTVIAVLDFVVTQEITHQFEPDATQSSPRPRRKREPSSSITPATGPPRASRCFQSTQGKLLSSSPLVLPLPVPSCQFRHGTRATSPPRSSWSSL